MKYYVVHKITVGDMIYLGERTEVGTFFTVP